MKYGYARVSTDGQSVDAQVRQLTKAGCKKVFREVASGAKTERAQLRRLLDVLDAGDVLTVTRLDRLARSTRDLLNTLAAITAKKAGFKSLGDTWADTTTSHGRLMLTVLGGLAEFERDLIRARTGEGRARAVAHPGRDHTRALVIALTAIIGSGKTILSRRLRAQLDQENKVIVSRSLSLDKAKIAMPLLIAALFYDLSTEKTVTISNNSERRERDLQELFRRAKKPVALFVDDAHDLHPKTLVALKRLIELVAEGGGQLSIVLVGHPKLKNDLRRPKLEEIGDRVTVFEFGGLRDQQRNYIDWVLRASLKDSVEPDEILTDEAATLLATKLKTPLQIGQHLVRAFEAGFEMGVKPIDVSIVEAVLSRQINDLEPQLTRNGYDIRSLVEQFEAKPAEIRQLLRGDLDPGRTRELMDEMRAAGLPT